MEKLPFFFVFVGSWIAVAGGIYGLFNKAGESVNEPTKRAVANWLQNINLSKELPNWPQTFTVLFDRVFTEEHWSWNCFGRSALISLLGLSLFLFLTTSHDQWLKVLFTGSMIPRAFWAIVPFIVLNLIPDYFSLLETRYIFSRIVPGTSFLKVLGYLLLDIIFTLLIFYFGTMLFVLLSDFFYKQYYGFDSQSTLFQDIDAFYKSMFLPSAGLPYLPFILTTFLTSIWVWLYAGSAFLLKLIAIPKAGLKFLRNSLDITNRPFRAMGFTLMVLASIGYLVWGVVLIVTW